MPTTINCKCGNNTFYFAPTGIMCLKCLTTISFSSMKEIVDKWWEYQEIAAKEENDMIRLMKKAQ